MQVKLLLDVSDLLLCTVLPTNRAALKLRQSVLDSRPVLVLFDSSFHKPVSVNANQMESVEAAFDSDKVDSVSEMVFLALTSVTELFQAHRAPPFNRIIVIRQNFPHLLMKIVEQTRFVFVVFFVLHHCFKPIKYVNQKI